MADADGNDQLEEKRPAPATTSNSAATGSTTTTASSSSSGSGEATSSSSSSQLRGGRTNSERGFAFRERQRLHECELVRSLSDLKKEIHDLHVTRELKQECALQTRQSLDGSLVKLVREYQRVFALGIPDPDYGARGQKHLAFWTENLTNLLNRQQEFVRCVVHPDIKIGPQSGIAALNETWRRYTKYHHNFRMEAGALEVSGTAEDPIVIAYGFLHTRYSRDTFRYLFPHVAGNEVLMAKFIGREVVYPFRNVFYFTREGLIYESSPDVQFVEALVNAGGSLEDVTKLMDQALIADQYVIGGPAGEEDEAQYESSGSIEEIKASREQYTEAEERESRAEIVGTSMGETEKLDLSFILSTEPTESDDALGA